MTEQQDRVITTMETYGGSFVQALAVCFRRADSINFVKLLHTFPEYWNEYAEMSELK